MNYLSLILRIVAILAAIAAGMLYLLLAGKLDEKEKKLAQVQTELQILLDKNETADLEISELQEDLTEENKLIEEANIKLEEAKAKLVAEMQESQRVQKKLIETQQKVTQQEETITRLRQELVNAESLFAAASQENLVAQLEERIEELTAANSQLRDEIKTSTLPSKEDSPVDTESKTNVTPSEQFTVRTLTADEANSIKEEAKIASLRTENGIIVLDSGEQTSLETGTTVDLAKASTVIARVKIINVNGSLAIAYIRPGANLSDLSKGDTVKILR